MEMNNAVTSLSALAQESRLEAFRLLVRAGPEGLPSGDVARALNVPANTVSTHLSILTRAGLVSSRRDGRHVIYQANLGGIRKLIDYLLADCCQGDPELCGSLLEQLTPHC